MGFFPRLRSSLLGVWLLFIIAAASCTTAEVKNAATDTEPPPPTASTSTTLAFPEPSAVSDPGGFAAVSAGWGYTCGLRASGVAECWRWGKTGSETFWSFAHEKRYVNLDWDSSPQAAEPPGGVFVEVSAGREAACGLRPTGRIECWGNNRVLNDPPEGVFAAVSAGIEHACGLRHSGRVECWGASTPRGNAAIPPDGKYTDIAAADLFTCGIQENDGTVECWGTGFTVDIENPEVGQDATPPGKFTSIVAGRNEACGMRADGSAECWANHSPDYRPYPIPTGSKFASINISGGIACGKRPDGSHECWEADGRIVPVALGDYSAVVDGCGALRGGGLECWSLSGEELPESERLSDGEYVKLSKAHSHMCGLRPDGGVECWAWHEARQITDSTPTILFNEEHPVSQPPSGIFTNITSGTDHACGLRSNGSVECWGRDLYGETRPPQGTFTKISASAGFTCGLHSTGKIECWGEFHPHSKIVPPQKPLTSVSAGWGGHQFLYKQGVSVSYSWVATGIQNDSYPQLASYYPTGIRNDSFPLPDSSPNGIQSDWGYSCGLRPDRTARCWGDPAERLWNAPDPGWERWPAVLRPPAGEFTEVQTGRRHACGLRDDKKLICWGYFPNLYFHEPLTGYIRGGVYPDSIRADPEGYTAFSVGGTYTCALRSDKNIECWGDGDSEGYILQEGGPFTAVSAGYDHHCGLLTTGDIRCWAVHTTGTISSTTTWETQTYTPTDK